MGQPDAACYASFWGGFATLPQNYTPHAAQVTQALHLVIDMDIEQSKHNQSNLVLGLVWMLIAVFIVGFIESEYFRNTITSKNVPTLLTNCIVGIGFLAWLKEDAKKQNHVLSKIMKFFAVVFPQITVFVYCFKSRGFKGGVIQSLKAIGFIFLCLVVFAITALLFD